MQSFEPSSDVKFFSHKHDYSRRGDVLDTTRHALMRGDAPAPAMLFAVHDVPERLRVGLGRSGADTRLIQDYQGHRNIRHTVIYVATNPARFEWLWR